MRRKNKALIQLGLTILVGLVIVLAATHFAHLGHDYNFMRSVSEQWLRGETRLYDEASRGFFYFPWALAILIPLTWFPYTIGQALWDAVILVSLVFAIFVLREDRSHPIFYALAIGNLYILGLVSLGQIDGQILAGVALGWLGIQRRRPGLLSAGLWLMSIKPTNVGLAALLFLPALLRWNWRERLTAIALPLFSAFASFFVFGFDWPWRYLENLRAQAPNPDFICTIWRAANELHLTGWLPISLSLAALSIFVYLVRRDGVTIGTLSLALATNLVVTPYAIGPHNVLLIPAFLLIARRRPWLTLPIYALTFLPMGRLAWGSPMAWVEIVYPLTTWIVLIICLWPQNQCPAAKQTASHFPATGPARNSNETAP